MQVREKVVRQTLGSTSVLNELADAALKDITNSNIPENILAEFTLARNFSKNLHKRFSTGFNAELLGLTGQASGDLVINPALSLTRAYSGGGLDANVNLGQMQEAASETDIRSCYDR